MVEPVDLSKMAELGHEFEPGIHRCAGCGLPRSAHQRPEPANPAEDPRVNLQDIGAPAWPEPAPEPGCPDYGPDRPPCRVKGPHRHGGEGVHEWIEMLPEPPSSARTAGTTDPPSQPLDDRALAMAREWTAAWSAEWMSLSQLQRVLADRIRPLLAGTLDRQWESAKRYHRERDEARARVTRLEEALRFEALHDCECHCCAQLVARAEAVLAPPATRGE